MLLSCRSLVGLRLVYATAMSKLMTRLKIYRMTLIELIYARSLHLHPVKLKFRNQFSEVRLALASDPQLALE